MDLNRVATFVRVVEDGGFTAAAKSLGLPKSSVSRSVALLERQLGVRLLLRSTRAVKPTEAGTTFYKRASAGLDAVYEAREVITELDAALSGRIRITAPLDAGNWLLAPLITEFCAIHPNVDIDVMLTSRTVDLIDEGLDLALRAGALRDESLIARKLPTLDFALYAAPRYIDDHGTPKRIADLARHRFVTFRTAKSAVTLVGPRGERKVNITGSVIADDLSFVFQATVAGAGLALLPSFIAASETSTLLRVLPKYHVRGGPFHLVYPSARYVPRRVAAFRDFLLDRLTAL